MNSTHDRRGNSLLHVWTSLALCILVLVGAVLHIQRHNLRAGWMQLQFILQCPLAEHFASSDRRDAPLARRWLSSFGDVAHYSQANRALPSASPDRIVLYGDSITEFWPLAGAATFFSGHRYIDRGIRGQSTPELLWRFRDDVLNLHPGTVVLLGGTNDILHTDRHINLRETEDNLQSMVAAAQRQHIRVILCQLTPMSIAPPARQRQVTRQVRDLNAWIAAYAKTSHLPLVDYFDALAAPDGSMRQALTSDGIHPNQAGYALMLPLAQQAIQGAK